MFKRTLAVMLLLILIPTWVAGEAFHYKLSFTSMEASEGSVLAGMLDFLKMLEIEGSFHRNDDRSKGFEMTASMVLDGDESTRMDFSLWGLEALFHVVSPVWNNENIVINVPALLEYGMKIYNHLDIPLQRFFILYPYASCDAFTPVWWALQDTMRSEDEHLTEWTVSSDKLTALGERLSNMLYDERGVRIWLDTMTSFNAAGEELTELWMNIPEWLSSEVPEVTVNRTETSEIWKTGTQTLFSSETQSDGSYALHVFLPGFVFGENASFDYVRTMHGDTYDVDLSLVLGTDEHLFVQGTFQSHAVPCNWPASAPFDCVLDFHGPLLYGLSFIRKNQAGLLESAQITDTLHAELSGDGNHVSLMSGDDALITAHVSAETYVPETEVYHRLTEWGGLNFFSLHDSTLNEFLDSAKDSMIEAALPLIIHAPVSTVVSLMDVLQEAGILDILAYGLDIGSEDEEWEGESSEDYDESDEEESSEDDDESYEEEASTESVE